MTSDHITPWSERQKNSGNNWAWLGAALAGTSLPFGSLAIPGGWRYHPMVLAHMIATLAEMFPGRLRWVAVGSGEAMNEALVGHGWPDKQERNARLHAGTDIVRRLLRGEVVNVREPWFAADSAKLWSLPDQSPALFGAALTADTAGWLADWTDGLLTVRKTPAEMAEILGSFEQHGGAGKPRVLQLQLAWGRSRDEARMAAWDQWRCAAAPPAALPNLRTPQHFDDATAHVTPHDMDSVMPLVVRDVDLLDILAGLRTHDFDEVYIHNVSRDQKGFFSFMSQHILPALTGG